MSWRIPVKTEHMKQQSEHEPSMRYAEDIYYVVSRQKPIYRALEIGGAWGFSTLAILENGVKELITVDPNTMAEASNEAMANGYKNHQWRVIRSDKFWEENTEMYDLIYVDGSHLYKDVRGDLYEGWKCLNKGGSLLVDDWDHKKNQEAQNSEVEYGVSLACFEFWRDNHESIDLVDIHGRVLWFKKEEK